MSLLLLLRGDETPTPDPPVSVVSVTREKPPLRVHVTGITPGGDQFRWGGDEPAAANRPTGLRWSDTMPGGFDRMGCTLPRKPGIDYSDLRRLSTLQVRGAGGELAWEGRLERAPRVSGEQMAVSPDAVGWQAHLEDDRSASIIFRDYDLGRWSGPSAARRLSLINAGSPNQTDPSAAWDDTVPALVLSVSGQWPASPVPRCEAWYDAGAGNRIKEVLFAFSGHPDTVFVASASAHPGPDSGASSSTGDYYTTPSGAVTFRPTVKERYARLDWFYGAAGGAPAAQYDLRLSFLAVIGDHTVGTYIASEMIAFALGRWAPLLSFSTGANGTIQTGAFPVPQASFPEPTTIAAMIQDLNRYELFDWAVWDDRTFWYHRRGYRGRRWTARVAPSGLEETGPQIDRTWNGILVQYQDVDGSTRTVGPPGSGVETESASLLDPDPANPANELNLRRWDLLNMGIVSTPAAAIQVGSRFLQEAKQLDRSGRARFVGHVEDQNGVLWPYWMVRAGDTVEFVDAADTSPRRIVRAEKDAESRSCTVDLDSPPEGLDALLARLGVSLVPLGM